jgi:hypothetical protein
LGDYPGGGFGGSGWGGAVLAGGRGPGGGFRLCLGRLTQISQNFMQSSLQSGVTQLRNTIQ